MPRSAVPSSETDHALTTEVVARLREVDQRQIHDARGLASAWIHVRSCDSVVLEVLDPSSREDYQAVVDGRPRRRRRSSRWSDRSLVRSRVGHLRVQVHRRLIVLGSVTQGAA